MNFLKECIYGLKRDYPARIDLYARTGSSFDYTTGLTTESIVHCFIETAIAVPADVKGQQFKAALAKHFNFGGFNEMNSRHFIIDGEDVDFTFEIRPGDSWVIFDGQRFEVDGMEKFQNEECLFAYVLKTKATPGVPLNQIFDASMQDNMAIVAGAANG